jgi:hypothetical protein
MDAVEVLVLGAIGLDVVPLMSILNTILNILAQLLHKVIAYLNKCLFEKYRA